MTTTPPGGPADQPPGTPGPHPGPQHPGDQPYGQTPGGQDYGGQPYGGSQPHGGQPSGGPPHGYQPRQPSGDDRTIAVVAHLSPLIALVVSAGWLSFVGPLLVWFIWRERGPLVRNAAAGAFNFNLTVWLLVIIGWICLFTVILIPLALVLWLVAFIAQLVLSIRAAMAANRGEMYRYPMQLKVLS